MEWVYIPTGAIVQARDGKSMPAALYKPVTSNKQGEADKPAKAPAKPKRKAK